MSAPFLSFRTPLSAVTAALLLAGCAYHSEYHAAGVGPRHSIKDDPEPASPRLAQAPRASVQKAASRSATETSPRAEKAIVSVGSERLPAAASEPSSADRKAPQSASVRFEAPVAPAAKAGAETKAAVVDQAPLPAVPPRIAAPPAAVAPPAAATPSSATGDRTTAELRRSSSAAVAAPASAPAPVAPAPAVVAAAEPPAAKPPATNIVIQPKPNAPAAQAAPEAKVAALSDEQRVRDAISRAQDYLKTNRVINARSLLADAARDDNPILLTALAETFDPLHLQDKYPSLTRAADPQRALDIYRRASERGSQMAAQKLKALAEFLRANPGFIKQ